LVALQNRWREVSAGHTSRSSGLLHMEAYLARVSQSSQTTSEGTTMGDARGTITEVAWEAC
jgi:Tfp pilus assembly protein PilV